MSLSEVEYFLKGLNARNREAWEQTRIIGYIIAQSNSTKELKQTDILRLPWDEPETKKSNTGTSDSDKKRLREKAKQIELQNKTIK